MKPLRIIAKLLIILLVFSLVSCDENIFTDYADDSSDEAQLEAALIYLDDGEYSKAKAILETLDQNDSEVKRALASCYAGLAGLDVPTLIAAIDDSNNNGIETVGEVLGGSDKSLTASEISVKTSDIEQSISLYENLNLTDSVKAQLCILYATRTVLVLADRVGVVHGYPVPLDASISGLGVASGDFDATSITKINESVDAVNNYIDSIDSGSSDGNSLRDGFDQFLTDIGYSGGISDVEIAAFVNNTN